MIPLIGILGLVAASRIGAKGVSGDDGQGQPSKPRERSETGIKDQECGMAVLALAAPDGLPP